MTIAVGFFDGVHLGHQAILKGADLALTFSNHPLSLLAPEKAPKFIMSVEDRLAAIRACGVKDVLALAFTRELAEMTPDDFIKAYLLSRCPADELKIRSGANWHFGKGGKGSSAYLREHGLSAEVIPYAEYKGEPISSTRIRRALEAGEIAEANAMMGRAYAIHGTIITGKGLGRTLGYPTLNVNPNTQTPKHPNTLSLPRGVYAVSLDGCRAVANYGFAPTVGDLAWKEPIWELHLLDQAPGTKPQAPSFSVLRYLRPERKFASVEELKSQIALDCQEALR